MNRPNHQWIKTTSWKGKAAVTSCKEMIWLFHYGKWILRESGSGDFNGKLWSDQLNLKSKNENHLLRKRNHQIEDSLNGFPVKREQLPGFSFIMILICRLRNEYWTFWGFLWGAGELGRGILLMVGEARVVHIWDTVAATGLLLMCCPGGPWDPWPS